MSIKRTFIADRDTWIANNSGVHSGNGKGPYLVSGPTSGGVQNRAEISFPSDFSGVVNVLTAYLQMKVQDGGAGVMGANPCFFAELLTAGFTEGSVGGSSTSTSNAEVWPGQAATSSHRGKYNPSSNPSTGSIISVDITGMVEAQRAANAKNIRVRLLAADPNSNSYDESGGSRTIPLHSVQGSYKPRIVVTFKDNQPPLAPTVTSPVQGDPAIVGTAAGKSLTVEFLFSDPDAQDVCGHAELKVYGDGATDGAPGSLIATTGSVVPVAMGPLNAYRVTISGLPARTTMRFTLLTQDGRGAWGPGTSLANGRFKTANLVGIPLAPVMGTNPAGPPHIGGTLNSPDSGDFLTAWEGEFYRDTSTGRVTLWAAGPQTIGGTSTRSDITYGGTALNTGDVVVWRHRQTNRDGITGPFSPFYKTTMATLTGPTVSPPDANTKLLSPVASITITFDNALCDGYQWRLYRNAALIYDSGLVAIGATSSVVVAIPAGIANWGDSLTVDAADRPAGTVLGDFSPQSGLYIDQLPSTTLSVSA